MRAGTSHKTGPRSPSDSPSGLLTALLYFEGRGHHRMEGNLTPRMVNVRDSRRESLNRIRERYERLRAEVQSKRWRVPGRPSRLWPTNRDRGRRRGAGGR